jgi:hypothetical protein
LKKAVQREMHAPIKIAYISYYTTIPDTNESGIECSKKMNAIVFSG